MRARPPTWPDARLLLLLLLLLMLPHVPSASAIATPSSPSSSLANDNAPPVVEGVVYTPHHNLEYPVLGGPTDRGRLAAAIDRDLGLLRRYFTAVRFLAPTCFGIDLTPLAARHGLRVYLGVPLTPQPSSWNVTTETDAALRAIHAHPEALDAVLVGERELIRGSHSLDELLDTIDALRRRLPRTLAATVPFGLLEYVPGRTLQDPGARRRLAAHDIRVFGVPPMHEPTPAAVWTRHVEQLREVPTISTLFLEMTFSAKLPPVLDSFLRWTPPPASSPSSSTTTPGPRVVRFWDGAFDHPTDDPGSRLLVHPIGILHYDRTRKHPQWPRARDPQDDPLALAPTPPGPPRDYRLCPMGMYQRTVSINAEPTRLCMMNGYNFRTPTKFDERSLQAACANDWCHVVLRALQEIPTTVPCPFDVYMPRETMVEMILEPFAAHCPRLIPTSPEIREYGVNPCACGEDPGMGMGVEDDTSPRAPMLFPVEPFRVVWDPEHDRESCEVLSGFSVRDLQPLTQEVLEKMCFQPSCEYLMLQMANPPSHKRWCIDQGASSFVDVAVDMKARIAWAEEHILRPYYDGCYHESMFATTYFDTTYRERRQRPRLPSAGGDDAPVTPPLPSPTGPPSRPPPDTTTPLPETMISDHDVSTQDDDVDGTTRTTGRSTGRPSRLRNRPRAEEEEEEDDHGSHLAEEDKRERTTAGTLSRKTPTTRPPLAPQDSHVTSPSTIPSDDRNVPNVHSDALQRHSGASRGFLAQYPLYVAAVGLFVFMFVVVRRRRNKKSSPKVDGNSDSYCHIADNVDSCPLADRIRPLWADQGIASLFIHPHRLQDLRLLGGGGQGLVYLVLLDAPQAIAGADHSDMLTVLHDSPPTVRLLASKRLVKNQVIHDPTALPKFIAEIKIHASLRHPNIVSLVGVTWSAGPDLQALFEFMPLGDLGQHLSRTPRGPWTGAKLQLALDVIEALAYVHALDPPIVHRDIKSRNVLLTAVSDVPLGGATPGPESLRAKLTDFGVSRIQSKQQSMTTGVGTSRWLAPEVILGGGDYDRSCDIYSFGVLLSELDSHALPFVERRTDAGDLLPDLIVLQLIAMEGIQPAFGATSPQELVALARECLSASPAARPRAAEVRGRLAALTESQTHI